MLQSLQYSEHILQTADTGLLKQSINCTFQTRDNINLTWYLLLEVNYNDLDVVLQETRDTVVKTY